MALAIVQAKAHGNEIASGTTCHCTLGSAPINGNLLWCGLILDTADGAPSPGTGWVVDTTDNLNGVTVVSMYKYAGAGESATQQPVVNGEQFWGISMYEISGVTGVWATDHIATHLNPFPWQTSTGNVTSFNTPNNNELVIAMFGTGGGASGDNVTVSGTGGAGTRDDSNEGLGTGVSPNIPIFNLCNSWVKPTSGSTFNQSLANVNAQGLFYAIVELQSAASGSTETANVTMHLAGISYKAVRPDTSVATLALSKASFNVQASRVHVKTTVSMALNGVKIAAATFDLSALAPLRQFHTFG